MILFWILLLVAVGFLHFGSQVGECTDYTVESGAESTCTSGPLFGVPGTWALVILSLLTLGYFAYRIARRRVTR